MSRISEIIQSETSSGILLFLAALLALVCTNTPLVNFYHQLLQTKLSISVGEFSLIKPVSLWIDDGLMTIFFLLVGLEIKREMLSGVLNDFKTAILPIVGAFGGLLFPAIIYVVFNWRDPIALKGWAIPVATDIAFSLAILTLLGKRIPRSLKIFLTALAIIDDILAIIIIALFYTGQLSYLALTIAGFMIVLLLTLNKLGVKHLSPYCLLGIILWIAILKSGIHATLAGIILAFTIPLGHTKDHRDSPLIKAEHTLIPWVTYLILPLFAFANSGLSFAGLSVDSIFHPIPIAIVLGLFVGKQLGIFSSCYLLIKLGIAKLHHDISVSMLYGVAILCGVGFTMSLFIGSLAFMTNDKSLMPMVRLGILSGSLISGIVGYYLLYYLTRKSDDRSKHI